MPEEFVQCSDHPYCLQPEGHEEDPELLAIVEDAAYEAKMQDHDLLFNDWVDSYIEGRK